MHILGVTLDKEFPFSGHAKTLAIKTSRRLSLLQRVKELVGQALMLYKTQVRSLIEFAPLSCGGILELHLRSLNATRRESSLNEKEKTSTASSITQTLPVLLCFHSRSRSGEPRFKEILCMNTVSFDTNLFILLE